jgi:hypothetical protein
MATHNARAKDITNYAHDTGVFIIHTGADIVEGRENNNWV